MQNQATVNIVVPKSSSFQGIKAATIAHGSIGLVVWIASITPCLVFSLKAVEMMPLVLAILLVIMNGTFILCTCHTIYVISGDSFPCPGDLRDLRRSLARQTAATVIGVALFSATTTWFALYGNEARIGGINTDANTVNFGCSFSVFWNVIFLPLASVFLKKNSKLVRKSANTTYSPSTVAAEQVFPSGYVVPHAMPQQQIPTTNTTYVPTGLVMPSGYPYLPGYINPGFVNLGGPSPSTNGNDNNNSSERL